MRWVHSIVSTGDPLDVVSLADAKADLDVTFDDDDDQITQHIASAVDWVERLTGRFLTPTVVQFAVDCLTTPLNLPFGPVNELTSMEVNGIAITPRRVLGETLSLLPPLGSGWPSVVQELGAGIIVASYGYAPGSVPAGIKAAIKAKVRMLYDRPEGASLTADEKALDNALSIYRLRSI